MHQSPRKILTRQPKTRKINKIYYSSCIHFGCLPQRFQNERRNNGGTSFKYVILLTVLTLHNNICLKYNNLNKRPQEMCALSKNTL